MHLFEIATKTHEQAALIARPASVANTSAINAFPLSWQSLADSHAVAAAADTHTRVIILQIAEAPTRSRIRLGPPVKWPFQLSSFVFPNKELDRQGLLYTEWHTLYSSYFFNFLSFPLLLGAMSTRGHHY